MDLEQQYPEAGISELEKYRRRINQLYDIHDVPEQYQLNLPEQRSPSLWQKMQSNFQDHFTNPDNRIAYGATLPFLGAGLGLAALMGKNKEEKNSHGRP